MADGTLRFDTKIDNKGFETGLDKLKSFGKTAGKALVGTLGAAVGAVTAVTKQSIDAFAEYEQLVGGSKLLFGDAYDFVAEKAKDAYMTVQMSANDYLRQVNGFSTGLKTSLGGNEKAAAQLADKIVNAEADVVAATGATQEAVQNAFNGIMKGNFTMLDNLQLGIKPTQKGMQEVIDKVNDWNKAQGHATKYQLGNLADMEAALVDYIAMQGLAGYAANEAAGTIQGSIASMKGAWENLLVGFADDTQDFDALVSNLADTAVAVLDNVAPRVEKILGGIGQLLEKASPIIAAQLPGIAESLIPSAISAAISLVNGLISALPSILGTLGGVLPGAIEQILSDGVPTLLSAGGEILSQLGNGILNALPTLLPIATQAIMQLIEMFTAPEAVEAVIDGATQLISILSTGIISSLTLLIPAATEGILQLTSALISPENIAVLLNAATQIIFTLLNGLTSSIPTLIPAAYDAVMTFYETLTSPGNLSMLIDAAIQLIFALANGLIDSLPILIERAPIIVENLVNGIVENAPKLLKSALKLIVTLGEGIISNLPKLGEATGRIIATIIKGFDQLWDKLVEIGGNIVNGIWRGIQDKREHFREQIYGFFDGIVSGVKKVLGIASPSKVFAEIGKYTVLGMTKGINDNAAAARNAMTAMCEDLEDVAKNRAITIDANAADEYVSRFSGAIGANHYNISGGYEPENVPGSRSATVIQNFYTPTATPSQVARAAKKAQEVT